MITFGNLRKHYDMKQEHFLFIIAFGNRWQSLATLRNETGTFPIYDICVRWQNPFFEAGAVEQQTTFQPGHLDRDFSISRTDLEDKTSETNLITHVNLVRSPDPL